MWNHKDRRYGVNSFESLKKLFHTIHNISESMIMRRFYGGRFCSLKLKLHLFALLWICCGYVVQLFDLLYSFSIFFRQVERHRLLHCFDLLWICCGFGAQLVVQQIHNKSNKWSLSFRLVKLPEKPLLGSLRLPVAFVNQSGIQRIAVTWNWAKFLDK
jgi:hypothetical protein